MRQGRSEFACAADLIIGICKKEATLHCNNYRLRSTRRLPLLAWRPMPAGAPRTGWADAFAGMARRNDDVLLDADTALATEWEKSEWRW